MTSSDLDLRLQRFRSRRDEYPHALASALIDAGRSNDALEVIHLGLLDNEVNLELLTLEGRAYYVQGDLPEAQRSLLRAAKIDPRNKEPYRWLAQVLIERGDAVRAVQVLERAIGLDPSDAALAQAYARAQRLSTANAARSAAPAQKDSAARAPVRAIPVPESRPVPRSTPPPAAKPAFKSSPPPGRAPAPSASPVPSARRGSEPRPSPSVPATKRASDSAAPRRGAISDLVARAGALSSRTRPKQDLEAEDLLREPLTDPGATGPGRLPFGEEVERDDAPTQAVEVPEEVRSWLRSGQPRPAPLSERAPPSERPPARAHEQVLGSDDEDDDEDSAPTAIVNVHQELSLLREEPLEGQAGQHDLAQPGEAEPPEQVLQLLQTQGVFESTTNAAPTQGWLGKTEIPLTGTPIRRALAVAWGLALLAAGGGYFGFQSWLDTRRGEALTLVEKARAEVLDGQHESLVLAEAHLSAARTLDPKSAAALSELLFVQAARVFDEGHGELGPLRTTLARADQADLASPIVTISKVLAQPLEQQRREIDALLALADRVAAQDARGSYVAARIAQHAGRLDDTRRLLARAVALEPMLALAQVGLGEQARAEGELEQAYERFGKALGTDKQQLRAELWLSLLEAKNEDAAALQQKLDGLMPRVERGSDADKLLAQSVRAFAAQAAGDTDKAKQALRVGSQLHVDDPELLALFSEQALRAGEHTLSYRAARAASEAGGDAARYQSIIAAALLQQGDGDAALTALGSMGEGHGALALARASAALLADSRDSLDAAKKELASYRATPVGKDDVEASSLLIRVDLRLGANVESLFPAARALVARAPTVAASHLALGEALLAAEQGPAAVASLEPALKLSPGSADVHYLLGRAQRMAGKPNEARASFERAVALAPNHVEAQRALGRTLLDGGEVDAALTLFRALESAAGSSATLGIIEALIAKGNHDEADKRFEALPAQVKALAPAQLLHARLDLRRLRSAEAVKTLEPLVSEDAESRTADALALYGDALYASEKVDSATAAYEAALELDEVHPDALIGRAVTALRANKADQALSLLARAEAALTQRARPASTRALFMVTRARAELQKNQLESARDGLARALALPGVPNEAYFWYGEVLAKLKSDQASAEYQRYLELEPAGLYAARAKRAL
jgi:Tfp pilus assembly protein PilF